MSERVEWYDVWFSLERVLFDFGMNPSEVDRLRLALRRQLIDSDAFIGSTDVEGLENDRYDVILVHINNDKVIQTIKAVRSVSHLGLKEAKDLVDKVRAFTRLPDGTGHYGQGRAQTILYATTWAIAANARDTIIATSGSTAEVVNITPVSAEKVQQAAHSLQTIERELKGV